MLALQANWTGVKGHGEGRGNEGQRGGEREGEQWLAWAQHQEFGQGRETGNSRGEVSYSISIFDARESMIGSFTTQTPTPDLG